MTSSADRVPQYVTDPQAWRALAHPVRVRLLHELGRLKRARAADLAEALGEPANSVSFHLRQLARYDLIEPAESDGGDRREKWWRIAVTDSALRLDASNDSPSSRQAMDDVLGVLRIDLHQQVDDWFDAAGSSEDLDDDGEATNWDISFDLAPDEWQTLKDELGAVLKSWRARSHPAPDRQTYRHIGFGANRKHLDEARRRREERDADS